MFKTIPIILFLCVAPFSLAQTPEVLLSASEAGASHLTLNKYDLAYFTQSSNECPAGELGQPCRIAKTAPTHAVSYSTVRVYGDTGPGSEQHIWSDNIAVHASAILFLGNEHVYRDFDWRLLAEPDPIATKHNPNTTGEVAIDTDYYYWTENTPTSGELYRLHRYQSDAPELVYTNPAGPLRQLKATDDDSGSVLLVTSFTGGDIFRDTLVHLKDNGTGMTATEGRALTESYTFDDNYVYQVTGFEIITRTLVRAPLSNINNDVSGIVLSNQNDGTTVDYIVVDDSNLYYYRNRNGNASNVIYRLDKEQWNSGNPQPVTGDIGVIFDLNHTTRSIPALVWRSPSGGILRLRKEDAQPISVDMSIAAVEVVQSVQTPDNNVTLIANKRTTARVYPRINSVSGVELINAVVTLEAEDIATGQLLSPSIPAKSLSLPSSFVADRSNFDHTVNFELPSAWTSGLATNIRLNARISTPGIVDTNSGNDRTWGRTGRGVGPYFTL